MGAVAGPDRLKRTARVTSQPASTPGVAFARDTSARPLRVALFTGSYNYIKDGVALTLNRLVAYLEAQGVEVLVFAPVAKVPALAHSGTLVPVPSIPLPFRSEYRIALGLPRVARERVIAFDPDIVHIAVPDLLGYAALRFARGRNMNIVASYHTRYETYLEHYGVNFLTRPLARYLRNFYRSAREIYVPSSSMADVLKAEGIDNIRLWTRGVDTMRFSPERRSSAWRARFGIGDDELAIVFVGRFVREKRLATLVDMFRILRARGLAYRAVLVGEGPEDEVLKKQLPDAVFPGFLYGDELAIAYASCDIFVFPSDTESFGNVTLEAMASALPCLCADATGSRSLVEHASTGFLSPATDAEAFADHVTALAADPSRRLAMGAASRARSLLFSWDEAMGCILGYYQMIAGSPPGGANQ